MKLFSAQFKAVLTIPLMLITGTFVTHERDDINKSAFSTISFSGLEKKSFTQQENKDLGIGPVKQLKLGPLNVKMIPGGKALFNNKCLLCHDLDQKKIGPPLRNITKIRTPEYIMNLLLNTVQMQQQDQVVKDLIAIYKVPMVSPNFSEEQARTVLEYLRSVEK